MNPSSPFGQSYPFFCLLFSSKVFPFSRTKSPRLFVPIPYPSYDLEAAARTRSYGGGVRPCKFSLSSPFSSRLIALPSSGNFFGPPIYGVDRIRTLVPYRFFLTYTLFSPSMSCLRFSLSGFPSLVFPFFPPMLFPSNSVALQLRPQLFSR